MSQEIINEFLSRVEKCPNSDCYIFDNIPPGGTNYGYFKGRNAHRAAWELLVGPIPEGLHVLHSCNRPGCISILCLYLGTHQDNMDYMVACGRSKHSGEAKAKMGEASAEAWKDPERRAKTAVDTAERWEGPVFREKMEEIMTSPEYQETQRKNSLAVWKDPAYQEKVSKIRASPAYLARQSAAQTGKKQSAATLLKRATSMKARTINLMALGG